MFYQSTKLEIKLVFYNFDILFELQIELLCRRIIEHFLNPYIYPIYSASPTAQLINYIPVTHSRLHHHTVNVYPQYTVTFVSSYRERISSVSTKSRLYHHTVNVYPPLVQSGLYHHTVNVYPPLVHSHVCIIIP